MKIKVSRLTESEIENMGIRSWPIWSKEVSKFEWFYDTSESCFFLEGRVVVETDECSIEIGKGDFVVFPKDCNIRLTL